MSLESFLIELEFGKQGQDFLINYLEKVHDFQFLAGERYNNVFNIDFIEQTETVNLFRQTLKNIMERNYVYLENTVL